jgi:hypothetical protein
LPVEEILEFCARLGGEFAVDVVQTVGAGETRNAAIVRSLVFAAGTLATGWGLSHVLARLIEGETGFWMASSLPVLALLGGYLCWRLVDEMRRINHWGEPEVTVGADGLLIINKQISIAWADIMSVSAERRDGSGRVRIRTSNNRARGIVIPSRRPEQLAAAIAAHNPISKVQP